MIVKGPQNIYNDMPNLENQNPVSRPDFQGNVRPTDLTTDQARQQEANRPRISTPLEISLKETKDLSVFFNAYRSYVHQLSATDLLVDKITSGVADLPKALGFS